MGRRLALVLTLLLPLLPAGDGAPRWQALVLPEETLAERNGSPEALVLRTLRLTLPTGARRVQFSDEDEPALVGPGETLAMRFTAAEPFRRAGLLVATDGGAAGVRLRLVDHASGRTVAEQTFDEIEDRRWLDLDTPTGDRGTYRLELRVERGRAGWWSQRLAAPNGAPAGFRIGHVPLIHNSERALPLNVAADRIALLGGLSSYDHGIGWWRDYEVQGDTGDRQFVGEEAGAIEIRYASGIVDRVPLIFGWTLWWRTHLSSERWGGPFPQPFDDPAARAARDAALRLVLADHPTALFSWEIVPRPEPIAALVLIDSPAKQGVPIIAAISVRSRDRIAGALPLERGPAPAPRPVTPRDLADRRWMDEVAPLAATLAPSERPRSPAPLPEPSRPDLRLGGSGALLTGVWRANRADLAGKFATDRPFRTSTPRAPNYGSYQGVGAWRDGAGSFADQVWARDLGRAALELLRWGEAEAVERALVFAGDRLYDLPNGYPRYARDGERLPPRWTTVLGEPLYIDADHRGDGNWENDSQGLLLLAYAAAWDARSRDHAWLARHAGTVRDAAEWFLLQLEQPERWRSRDGLLYGEGEAANDGGYDVLSNTLAWRSLLAAARLMEAIGEPDRARRFEAAAERIRAAVNRQLLDPDGWRSVAWNWGYGHEALAPVFTAADIGDYDLSSLTAEERAIAELTYRRQLGRCPNFACVRAVGYGQAFLAQSALLLDDLETAATLLETLAALGYDARRSPYLVPEGIAVSADGRRWYRTGDLGNAVHQAEVLKALALVAGIERSPSGVRLLPRLPAAWESLEVTAWPVPGGAVDLRATRRGDLLRYELSTPLATALRVGPLPAGERVLVNGAVYDGPTVVSGGKRWMWVAPLGPGQHTVEVTAR
ncbi:MAG: hypothetical protein NZ773_00500 [Dehalococcoidia bacterium]|nr:hypothetical protein [Dehalococcoidia bacterium]